MTYPLIKHCEDHLGPIASGWVFDEAGPNVTLQVALFDRTPIAGVGVLSTLGLSNVPMQVGQKTTTLRQELMVMFRLSDGPGSLPGILQQLAMEALQRDTAYSLGEIIGPRGELRPGATVSAFYIAMPVYLPDSFHVCRSTIGPVVFAWLVPITEQEASFVRARGREAFEDELESADPDLLDSARRSIV